MEPVQALESGLVDSYCWNVSEPKFLVNGVNNSFLPDCSENMMEKSVFRAWLRAGAEDM